MSTYWFEVEVETDEEFSAVDLEEIIEDGMGLADYSDVTNFKVREA